MAWSVYAERIDTADVAGQPRVIQKVELNKKIALKAVRTWVILFGAPDFDVLEMRIYSQRGTALGRHICTFDKTWTRAELSTEDYAVKEIYFDFNDPKFLSAHDQYYFVLFPTTYTGTVDSHVAWVRGIPDLANETDIDLTIENAARAPFHLGFIGAAV